MAPRPAPSSMLSPSTPVPVGMNGPVVFRLVGWMSFTTGLRARFCRCGDILSLAHIWKGCRSYDMDPFFVLLRTKVLTLVYLDSPTTDPERWLSGDMWFPLIALRSLELGPELSP